MLPSTEDLIRDIAAGEDTYLEFKEVVFKDNTPRFSGEDGKATKVIAEVFVSMANTDGGLVVFGVNKTGEVVGISPEKRDILEQWVINCALDGCQPRGGLEPRTDWRILPDRSGIDQRVLLVKIPKARYYVHQTTDGRFLKRVGSHRTPIPAEQLGRLLESRRLMIPFEERPCYETTLDAFNQVRFNAYYERRFDHSFKESGVSLERLLLNLKLARAADDGTWMLNNLGALLFSDRPQLGLPGAYVEVAAYDHEIADADTLDVRRFEGPVDDQIHAAITYLKNSPFLAIRSEKTLAGRLDKPAYSGLAVQEAIVNAVVHRDYELTGSQIVINLFPDRLEIRNPGGLHNTLTPENLYAGCQPMRRNQHLAGFLRDFPSPVSGRSLMEARGVGFLSLVRESETLSGRRPLLETIGQSVKLTLYAARDGG